MLANIFGPNIEFVFVFSLNSRYFVSNCSSFVHLMACYFIILSITVFVLVEEKLSEPLRQYLYSAFSSTTKSHKDNTGKEVLLKAYECRLLIVNLKALIAEKYNAENF